MPGRASSLKQEDNSCQQKGKAEPQPPHVLQDSIQDRKSGHQSPLVSPSSAATNSQKHYSSFQADPCKEDLLAGLRAEKILTQSQLILVGKRSAFTFSFNFQLSPKHPSTRPRPNVVNMPMFCLCPREARREGQARGQKPPRIMVPVLLPSSDPLDAAARRGLEGIGSHPSPSPSSAELCPQPAQCTHHGPGNGFLWLL